MKISVIVPFWNSEKWLARCLDSLQKQDGDFEFIIVDDRSTDDGLKIAKKYEADERFIVLENERSKGVSGARNTGVDYAGGDFVTFLDADDELKDEAYETLNRCAEFNKNIVQMNHLRYYTKIDKITLKYFNESGVYGIKKLPDCWWGVWNKLFKADFLNGIRFQEGLQYGEDGLFVLECLSKSKEIYHAEKNETAVIHRFDNSESLSHLKTSELLIQQIRAYEDFLFRQTDDEMRKLMCELIGDLWKLPRAKDLIGRYE